MQAGFGVDGGAGGIDQRAGAGEERLAAQSPFNGEVQPVLVQHGLQALLKALGRGFGAEAEVEAGWNTRAKSASELRENSVLIL